MASRTTAYGSCCRRRARRAGRRSCPGRARPGKGLRDSMATKPWDAGHRHPVQEAFRTGGHPGNSPMHSFIVASITQALTDWVANHGAYAIFAIMAIDAVLPAGGELTMLVAGALAGGALAGHEPIVLGHTVSTGAPAYVALALAGTLGYLAGSLIGWAIGYWGGRPLLERHGRWVHLNAENLDRAESWFDRHGPDAVFLGRLTPVVRSFISI